MGRKVAAKRIFMQRNFSERVRAKKPAGWLEAFRRAALHQQAKEPAGAWLQLQQKVRRKKGK